MYHLRNGYTITNEKELSTELDKAGGALRLTRKPIPRTCSRMEVQAADLQYDDERAHAEEMRNPNLYARIASVGLPKMVRMKRMMGDFKQLYIVSQNSNRSLASSQESSETWNSGTSGQTSPEDGPTRSGTEDLVKAEGPKPSPRPSKAEGDIGITRVESVQEG